jgi:hypothetical protein
MAARRYLPSRKLGFHIFGCTALLKRYHFGCFFAVAALDADDDHESVDRSILGWAAFTFTSMAVVLLR